MQSHRKQIGSVEEFYAHALQIEREAAARYWEFANQLLLYHENKVARIFLELAQKECEDLDSLERQAAGLRLPALASSDHRWCTPVADTAPLPVARCLMKPRQALEMALENQRRAKRFYERVSASVRDPSVGRLAAERALAEARHIERIERALRAR